MWRTLVAIVLVVGGVLALVLGSGPARQQQPMLDEDTFPRRVGAIAAADAPGTPGSIDELRARIATVLEREGVPGAGLALVGRDGPIWIGGVGVADRASRVPVDGDTVFRVASITKSIVGLGVMRLVEQGRLDLDRPLRELLPDVAIDNRWERVAPVTLAQALEHTAGLDDMRPNETFTGDDALTPAAALALNSRSRRIRWQPGTRMAYSNVGYSIAGRAIEVATGEPFDAWLRREILIPLGMPEADFRRTPALAARLATGYLERDHPAVFRPIAHRAAGSLLASPRDLAQLVQFWLRRGVGMAPIVSPAGLARIERTGTLPFPHTDIEYGLGNYGDVSQPAKARGHDGGWPGFLSLLRYFPDRGFGYVMLLNSTHSFAAFVEVRRLLFAYLARDRAIAIRDSLPNFTATSQRPDAAFYGYANPRHALLGFVERALLGWRATARPGGVELSPLLGEPLQLVATDDGGYRLPHESGTSVRFTHARDGTPAMIGGLGYAEAGSWWRARLRVIAIAIANWFVGLAPFYAAAVLVIAGVRRRRLVAPELEVWPAIAGLCWILMPHCLIAAAEQQVLGEVHPWTVAVFATSVLFAIASVGGLAAVVRWSLRADRPRLARRAIPMLAAVAAFGLALWLGANDIIGLRTWAW